MNFFLPILLMVIGVIAILVEFFLPTAGIIGIIGGICIISSVVVSYTDLGILPGTIALLTAVAGTPALLVVCMKIFPRTYFGSRLILKKSAQKEEGFTISIENHEHLIKQQGITLSALRPSGMARINNKKYSVISRGEFIEKNCPVMIIKIEGNKIVVKKI